MRVLGCRRVSIQSAVVTISLGLVFAGGCKQNKPDDMTMPPDRVKAITEADAVISTGEREIEDGNAMKDKDPEGAAKLIKQGEADKDRGEAMKTDALK